jgi:hypothetical protein
MYGGVDARKQAQAKEFFRRFTRSGRMLLSTQVVQEFYAARARKLGMPRRQLQDAPHHCSISLWSSSIRRRSCRPFRSKIDGRAQAGRRSQKKATRLLSVGSESSIHAIILENAVWLSTLPSPLPRSFGFIRAEPV